MEKDLSSIMVTAMNCGTMDNESLGLLLQGLKESAAEFRQAVTAVSYEVHTRLLETKGTELPPLNPEYQAPRFPGLRHWENKGAH